MKKVWHGYRDKCDVCGKDISREPFVDGKMFVGGWAMMCLDCHDSHGMGLGLGRGQAYGADGQQTESAVR